MANESGNLKHTFALDVLSRQTAAGIIFVCQKAEKYRYVRRETNEQTDGQSAKTERETQLTICYTVNNLS